MTHRDSSSQTEDHNHPQSRVQAKDSTRLYSNRYTINPNKPQSNSRIIEQPMQLALLTKNSKRRRSFQNQQYVQRRWTQNDRLLLAPLPCQASSHVNRGIKEPSLGSGSQDRIVKSVIIAWRGGVGWRCASKIKEIVQGGHARRGKIGIEEGERGISQCRTLNSRATLIWGVILRRVVYAIMNPRWLSSNTRIRASEVSGVPIESSETRRHGLREVSSRYRG